MVARRGPLRVRALPANGHPPPVAQPSVATDVHQTLDVHLHALAQVALDLALLFEDGADTTQFVFVQILDARIDVDLRLLQDRGRARAPDSVNVCEADLRALVRRKIDPSHTSHNLSISDCGFRIAD